MTLPMKNLLIIAFFLIISPTFSQKRAIKKTTKLFEKKEYNKCINYSKKQLIKYPKTAKLHYYLSYAMLKKKKNYDTAFYHFIEAKKLDKFNELKIQRGDRKLYDLHVKKVEKRCSRESLKDAQYFLPFFVRYFNDTLVCFQAKKENKEYLHEPTVLLKLKIDSIINYAISFKDKPYQYAAEGPNAFDCSGFILYVHKNFNINFPHNAHMISELAEGKEISFDEIQKGDLVFFGTKRAYHVGMYISDKNETPKIIHCVSRGVTVDDFTEEKHWKPSKVYKFKRFHKIEKD